MQVFLFSSRFTKQLNCQPIRLCGRITLTKASLSVTHMYIIVYSNSCHIVTFKKYQFTEKINLKDWKILSSDFIFDRTLWVSQLTKLIYFISNQLIGEHSTEFLHLHFSLFDTYIDTGININDISFRFQLCKMAFFYISPFYI